MLDFYNQRRRQLFEVYPNKAHKALAELEKHYQVNIITQNVDDLHERAGFSRILHLHGELLSVRSEKDPNLVYRWEKDLNLGDLAKDKSQLRPDIVWFGEAVPLLKEAISLVKQAHLLIIIGTSLQVYPAASLYTHKSIKTLSFITLTLRLKTPIYPRMSNALMKARCMPCKI